MLTRIEIPSPVGPLTLVAHGKSLVALEFERRWPAMRARLERRFGTLTFGETFPESITSRVAGYFAGDLMALGPIELDIAGTEFQMRVWSALRTLRPFEIISYQTLARKVGSPGAVRAVGTANGANPVAIVVPCHRVVRSDGSLGGYGGGLPRKEWLLGHERRHAEGVAPSTPNLPLFASSVA